MAQQLSLWEEAASQPAQQLFTTDDIMVAPMRWADGDTSSEALERLALVALGDWNTFEDTTGEKHMYSSISSGIVDGQVLYAWEYYSPLKYFYHYQFGLPIPVDGPVQQDEEDEEF